MATENGAVYYAIRVTADGAVEALGDVAHLFEDVEEQAQKTGKGASQGTKQMGDGAKDAAVGYAALAAAATKAFGMVLNWTEQGIAAANEYKAAVIGLNSVGGGVGLGQDELSAGLDQLTDKFFDTASAAASLKNLLSRGYTMDQAITTITRLKDAAAFGRQASLSLADAVKTATEGIKNENSILVDNAGVTKNVAKMWEDYAKSIGVSSASLTQAQKIEAEYQGILEETKHQVGDLQKAGDTLAGTRAEQAQTAKELSIAYGEAMTPAVQFGTEALNLFLGVVRDTTQAAPGLASGLSTVVLGVTGFTAFATATTAIKNFAHATTLAEAATKLFGVSSTAALGPIGVLIGLVGVGVGVYTQWSKAKEEAAQKTREEREELENGIKAREQEIVSLEALSAEYSALASKEGRTLADKARMKEIENELSTQHGITSASLMGQAEAYDLLTESIQEMLKAKRDEQLADAEKNFDSVTDSTKNSKVDVAATREAIAAQREELEALEEEWKRLDALAKSMQAGELDFFSREYDEAANASQTNKAVNAQITALRESIEKGEADIEEALANYADGVEAGWGYISAKVATLGDSVAPEMLSALEMLYRTAADNNPGEAVTKEFANDFIKAFSGINFDQIGDNLFANFDIDHMDRKGQVEKFLQDFKGQIETLASHAAGEPIKIDDLIPGWDELALSILDQKMEAVSAARELGDTIATTLQDALSGATTGMADATSIVRELETIRSQYAEAGEEEKTLLEEQYVIQQELLRSQTDGLATLRGKLAEMQTETEDLGEQQALRLAELQLSQQILAMQREQGVAVDEVTQGVQDTVSALDELKDAYDLKKEQRDLYAGWLDITKAVKDGSKATEAQRRTVQTLMSAFRTNDIDALERKLSTMTDGATGDLEAMRAVLDAYIADLSVQSAALFAKMEFEPTVDNRNAYAAIQELINKALELAGDLEGIEVGGGSSGRGGGGGSRKREAEEAAREAARAAEEAARAVEEAQQKLLDQQLEALERRKRMGEINTSEEIKQLERIMAKYAKTAEQRLELEQKIFDARARLRDEEISRIDSLNDAIITALRNRYQEQRDMEKRALDDSIDAWQTWSDETVAAIRAQIAALDEATKQEDREAEDEKYRRKLAERSEALLYETDEYNQLQIQKEIDRLQTEWDEKIRKREIADEKERLQEQIQTTQDTAKAEQDKLQEQKDAVDDYYDQLMKDASLRAEAERMLLEANQKEILDLVSQYAPDYEATGKSFGERFYKGLTDAMEGGIVTWFANFSGRLQGIADQVAIDALNAVDKHTATTGQAQAAASTAKIVYLSPQYTFESAVESPSENARKIEKTNHELAQML